jgi:transposase
VSFGRCAGTAPDKGGATASPSLSSTASSTLMQIPGVDWVVAAVVIAEIGVDMGVFLSVPHLAAWAGVCPGDHESAGKQTSGPTRKGNVHLRTILVGAAAPRAAISRTGLPLKLKGPARRPPRGACHRP